MDMLQLVELRMEIQRRQGGWGEREAKFATCII